MSGSSYEGSRSSSTRYDSWRSDRSEDRSKGVVAHRERVVEVRGRIERGEVEKPKPVARDVSTVRDPSLARNRLTSPSAEAKRAVVVLVDNSGSNRAIAEHLRNSSGYFTAFLRAIDPQAEVGYVYFSDHCDGARLMQEVDFVRADETGDRQLFSSLENVYTAGGGDTPEAIECALLRAARVDFAHVPRQHRTLVLVTDVVPHNMEGFREAFPGAEDDGCPNQQSWRDSMREVRSVYGQFVLIGSGGDVRFRPLQRKLFETSPGVDDEEEVARNFIDLSDIPTSTHRNGIVGNALLFVMARNAGKQTVPVFLAALYAKWLENPIFGKDTDRLARARIRSMAELYLTGMMTPSEIQEMLRDVLAE